MIDSFSDDINWGLLFPGFTNQPDLRIKIIELIRMKMGTEMDLPEDSRLEQSEPIRNSYSVLIMWFPLEMLALIGFILTSKDTRKWITKSNFNS